MNDPLTGDFTCQALCSNGHGWLKCSDAKLGQRSETKFRLMQSLLDDRLKKILTLENELVLLKEALAKLGAKDID